MNDRARCEPTVTGFAARVEAKIAEHRKSPAQRLAELHTKYTPRHTLRSHECKLRPSFSVQWIEPCDACRDDTPRCSQDRQPWPCDTAQVIGLS